MMTDRIRLTASDARHVLARCRAAIVLLLQDARECEAILTAALGSRR